MHLTEFIKTLNEWGQQQVPFLFLVDYEMKKPLVWRISEVDQSELLYDFHGVTNAKLQSRVGVSDFQIVKPAIASYEKKFHSVIQSLNRGDTFLANLTDRTEVKLNVSLKEVFYESRARYKIWYRDEFVFFSPEIFVQIHDQRIYSFPMKGTIDASIPNAAQVILSNEKEMAEHVTMVDLIRNDLSLVANAVEVTKFRYVEELKTNQRNLLQVSSQIEGELSRDYQQRIGDILVALLPAGSISGAPKRKTCELLAPSVNSYRRINAPVTNSGATWSPNTISFAGNNRTHMIRIPGAGRFELRLVDGTANPYLLSAAILEAGLDGLEHQRDPGKPSTVNAYLDRTSLSQDRQLPDNMLDALRAFEANSILRQRLGEDFTRAYLKLKRAEWRDYAAHVSAWELANTLDC